MQCKNYVFVSGSGSLVSRAPKLGHHTDRFKFKRHANCLNLSLERPKYFLGDIYGSDINPLSM